MPVGRAPGYPDYTSGGTNKFIPQIWAGKLLVKFYLSTVFAEISNTDYEGEIKGMGDEVIIRSIPSATIKTYTKGMNLVYESLESPSISLLIDKGKYWGLVIDDIDKYQSDIKLIDQWATDAAEQMKISIDSNVLGSIYADVAVKNKGLTAGAITGGINLGVSGTPLALTKANVVDFIVDCGQVLTEQNVPETGRFMVIPAWMSSLLLKSDIKDAALTGDSISPLRNGKIGMIDTFTLYKSNQLALTTDGANSVTNMIFGTTAATTFAMQITELETIRAERTFGDLMRGLNVYGFKVIKPEALGWGYVYKG